MSSPNGESPAGSLAVGAFAAWRAQTESDAKASLKGVPLNAWGGAQGIFHENVASTAGMFREVTRLDNRIDQLVIGDKTVILHTFSTSGTWTKPAGATSVYAIAIGGSSGGSRAGSANVNGLGGYSGGWDKATILASELPSTVTVTVGAGSAGGTSDGAVAGTAGDSSFGTWVTGTGATGTNYGSGNHSFRTKGGDGGRYNGNTSAHTAAQPGGAGSFHPGGEAGAPEYSGNNGVNGHSITVVGQIGMGSSGGGGASQDNGSGGRGGDGGWPSGGGGGGGSYYIFGFAGNGGNGAGGVVFVMTYLEDKLGVAPSTPTGVSAANITSSSAQISWTASTDDIAVGRYEVLVDGVVRGDSTTIQYDLTGLAASTTYSITVRAVDLGGNRSDASTAYSLTTTA